MKAMIKTAALAATLAFGTAAAQGSITLNLGVGDLFTGNGTTPLPTGSTLVLLVDANNDHSFGDLTQATSLFQANPIDQFGDQVVARVATNDFLGDPGTYLDGLVLNIPSLAGRDMLVAWYNRPFTAGDQGPGLGVQFGTFRTDSVIDGSTIGWTVPADGSTNSLNFITATEGGTVFPDSRGTANQTTAVPEPTSLVLCFVGAGLMLICRRNRVNA